MQADLPLFLFASLVVAAAPGAFNLEVLARAAARGPLSGTAAALGFASGFFLHALAAVALVAALLSASPMAFDAVRLAGVAYLMWLAVRVLRTRGAFEFADAPAPRAWRRVYGAGLLAAARNPRGLPFFLAYLPPFVNPWIGHPERQMFWLAVVFAALAAAVFLLVACGARPLGRLLGGRPEAGVWLGWFAGLVYLFLAVRTVWQA